MKTIIVAMLIAISLLLSVYAETFKISQDSFTSNDNGDGTYSVSWSFTVTNLSSDSFASLNLLPSVSSLVSSSEVSSISVGHVSSSGSASLTWTFDTAISEFMYTHDPVHFTGVATTPLGEELLVDVVAGVKDYSFS